MVDGGLGDRAGDGFTGNAPRSWGCSRRWPEVTAEPVDGLARLALIGAGAVDVKVELDEVLDGL
jgi:hypothetical protein